MNFIRHKWGSNFMNFPLEVILTTGDDGSGGGGSGILDRRKKRRRGKKKIKIFAASEQRSNELSDLQNNSRRVPFITCLFSRPKSQG